MPEIKIETRTDWVKTLTKMSIGQELPFEDYTEYGLAARAANYLKTNKKGSWRIEGNREEKTFKMIRES